MKSDCCDKCKGIYTCMDGTCSCHTDIVTMLSDYITGIERNNGSSEFVRGMKAARDYVQLHIRRS